MWIGGDVADNPAWRCTETRCSYSVQQRGGLRQDDDRPGWPGSDVLVSPHVLACLGYAARRRPVYGTSTPLTRLIDIAHSFFRVHKIAHSRICQSLK